MKRRYICDITKLWLACLSVLVLSGLVWGCWVNEKHLAATLFLALDGVYIYLAVKNASIIQIDDEKVEKRTLGRIDLSFSWEQIQEAGFLNKKYVYFSKDELNDDARCRMSFSWPPDDKIYFRAGKAVASEIELLWNRRGRFFIRYQAKRFL